MFKNILCSLLLLSVVGTAQAALISVSEQQSVTEAGELVNFDFASLVSSDGTGGQLFITLDGDYSSRNPPPLSEGATVTLDTASGMLELYNNAFVPSIFSNSIDGLSLNSTSFAGSGNDITLGYTFDISALLLTSMLSDNNIFISVQNTADVNPAFGHFIQVGIEYNSQSTEVPEPSTIALLALGWLGLSRFKCR